MRRVRYDRCPLFIQAHHIVILVFKETSFFFINPRETARTRVSMHQRQLFRDKSIEKKRKQSASFWEFIFSRLIGTDQWSLWCYYIGLNERTILVPCTPVIIPLMLDSVSTLLDWFKVTESVTHWWRATAWWLSAIILLHGRIDFDVNRCQTIGNYRQFVKLISWRCRPNHPVAQIVQSCSNTSVHILFGLIITREYNF